MQCKKHIYTYDAFRGRGRQCSRLATTADGYCKQHSTATAEGRLQKAKALRDAANARADAINARAQALGWKLGIKVAGVSGYRELSDKMCMVRYDDLDTLAQTISDLRAEDRRLHEREIQIQQLEDTNQQTEELRNTVECLQKELAFHRRKVTDWTP